MDNEVEEMEEVEEDEAFGISKTQIGAIAAVIIGAIVAIAALFGINIPI